jgi:diamine N-acetyltransferase
MSMTVSLRPVTAENWITCLQLEPTEEQKRRGFVAPNAVSLAQAHYEPWWMPLGIYADETMVGFVMVGRWPETGIPPYHEDAEPGVDFILRLMIDAHYQGKGYAQAALSVLMEQRRALPGYRSLEISVDPENTIVQHVCVKVGFAPTGKLWGGEIVMRLS